MANFTEDTIVRASLYTHKVQIRYNYLLSYYQQEYDSNSSFVNHHDLSQYQKENKTYSGEMTIHAKRRIQQTIHKLLIASPKRKVFNTVTKKWMWFTINFITLTIPNTVKILDAKEGNKNLLQPFLRVMRKKYQLRGYIWKAEIQKNGQLHYHLTTNAFIHLSDIKDTWNNILDKNGLLEEFKKQYNHSSPNSTDVHKVYKINDVAAYLAKYISKTEQNATSLKSKIWDCNLELKAQKLPTLEVDGKIGKELISMLESGECYEFTTEFIQIVKSNKPSESIKLPKKLNMARNEFITTQQNLHLKEKSELFTKTEKIKDERVIQHNGNSGGNNSVRKVEKCHQATLNFKVDYKTKFYDEY